MLLPSFHIGWNCSSSCQALETLVGVIDKNPVFVLVVSLWVVACCHWEDIEEMELSFGIAEFVFIQNTGCGIRQNVSKGKKYLKHRMQLRASTPGKNCWDTGHGKSVLS